MKITLFTNGQERDVALKEWKFPGGEVGVKLESVTFFDWDQYRFKITSNATSSDELIKILMANDALRRVGAENISLFLPYMPYARQDRVCNKGESHSLKIAADLINSCGFDEVTVLDPHSDVTSALLNNLRVISQVDIICKSNAPLNVVLVAPDAGANKKTAEIAKAFGHKEFVRADKLRDLATGKIIETIVYKDDFQGADVLVSDDIADGAATFVELAKVCKAKNCGKFYLYVTHGIFSRGLDFLFQNGIDEVFTTNSFRNDLSHEKLHVLDIDKI